MKKITLTALSLLVITISGIVITAQANSEWELWEVTAYCSCEQCCSRRFSDGKFASGRDVYFGGVAADERLPFGTHIEIRTPVAGHREFIVEDRGSAIKGNRIDVWFPTHQEALNFGRQKRWIKINPLSHGR